MNKNIQLKIEIANWSLDPEIGYSIVLIINIFVRFYWIQPIHNFEFRCNLQCDIDINNVLARKRLEFCVPYCLTFRFFCNCMK